MIRESKLFPIWIIAIAMVTVLRLWIRQCFDAPRHHRRHISVAQRLYGLQLAHMFTETYGITFGTTGVVGRMSTAEKWLIFFTSTFGFLAGALFAGTLFERITSVSESFGIKTMKDLQALNFSLIAPPELSFSMRTDR